MMNVNVSERLPASAEVSMVNSLALKLVEGRSCAGGEGQRSEGKNHRPTACYLRNDWLRVKNSRAQNNVILPIFVLCN